MSYDTVSMATLVEMTLGHRDLAVSELNDPVNRRNIGSAIAARMEEAWEKDWWPTLMLMEERTPVSLLIAWNQTDETRIGTPRNVWTRDPRVYDDAYKLAFGVTADGIRILPVLLAHTTVFLEFRPLAPALTFEKHATSRPYLAGEAAYDETTRDSYLCLTANTGAALSNATYWARQSIPAFLAMAVSLLAASDEWQRSGAEQKAKDFLARGTRELGLRRWNQMQQPAESMPNDCMTA
jgi:hypothetical protein